MEERHRNGEVRKRDDDVGDGMELHDLRFPQIAASVRHQVRSKEVGEEFPHGDVFLEKGPATAEAAGPPRGESYRLVVCFAFSTIRKLSTPNAPGTSCALMPATFLSASLSTTP